MTIISAVLPTEFQTDKRDVLEGMKTCSRDLEFQIDFFFEDGSEALKHRILEEEKRKISAVLTEKDLDENADDLFVNGYETVQKIVENSPRVVKPEEKEECKVGIAFYNGEDSFIMNLVEDMVEEFTKEGGRVVTALEDAQGSQQRQNVQIEYLMEQGCDVIAVNPVDSWSASRIIHRAKEEDIPVIFFNREPPDEDFELWDKAYYVGSDGRDLGRIQGEILTEAFEDEMVDKNKDGILQYILVEGEEGHSDSIRRTDAMHEKVKEDLPIEQIQSIFELWDKAYYVGSDGRDLGRIQGEILTEAFEDEMVDKNKDGILQYILVEGEEGHSDSIRRTDAMHEKVKEDLPIEQIQSIFGGWDREKTREHFRKMDEDKLRRCEAVVCNNDDMALGVLDAFEERQMEAPPIVLGINGSEEAIEEIENGRLYGTVSQKNKEQAEKIVDIFRQLFEEKVPEGPQKIYILGEKLRKTTEK